LSFSHSPCVVASKTPHKPITDLSKTGSYPFQDDDPFVMTRCPHLYFVGCQPHFSTKVIHGPQGQAVRLVTVPSFSETKEVVLVDTETLDITKVKIATIC
jgi:DNA polymerase delta subunit 2